MDTIFNKKFICANRINFDSFERRDMILLIFIILFFSNTYSQNIVKLWKNNEPLKGTIIVIKPEKIEFEENTTGSLYEFNKSDIDYIVSIKGDTLWFKNLDSENFNHDDKTIFYFSENVQRKITLFFNYNFSGSHRSKLIGSSGTFDVNSAIAIGAEYDAFKFTLDVVKLGFGVTYQFPRKYETNRGAFNFIPVYAFLKLGIFNHYDYYGSEKINIYLFPSIGYNFFSGDKYYSKNSEITGGLYNSFGFGMVVNNKLDIKFLYLFNRGSIKKNDNSESDILYRSLGLNFGYCF